MLRTAIGIADALDHAHRHSVVHRDLKPANIMLIRDGVKLLDFGLAQLMECDEDAVADPTRSARLTAAGTIVGTVPCMAAEQIEGRDVDARADIVAFGVVLYEMVCGRRRNETSVLGRVSAAWTLFPIHGGEPQPVPSLTDEETPLHWSHNGRYVYTVRTARGARDAAVDVFRIDQAPRSTHAPRRTARRD
jgi:serine/threonine protein kinase